jgi:ribonuclease Z
VPLPEETATQMIYVCQAPDVPGKFDNAKATALKVPFGPIRGKLVRGEAIEVDDPVNPGQKRVVKPEDVIGGGSEGAVSSPTLHGHLS